MRSTLEFQKKFIHALLTQDMLDGVFNSYNNIDRRLEVYRRNFMQGYCEALKKTYAMTAVCLGGDFYNVAVKYVCQNRPLAGQLFSTYGERFPDYIEQSEVKDLARLEWVLQAIIMAREDASDFCQIKSVFPENLLWQRRSDVAVFYSDYPVGELYKALRLEGINPKLNPNPSYYCIYRQEGVPVIFPISRAEYTVLNMLQSSMTIGQLFDILTFSQEMFGNILQKIFTTTFLKVKEIDDYSFATKCADL
ncbi:MAG: putative DNA-binding domain-containing protein [Candidatus Paracaedibacteraceae bacterium]|nr:putative DNA-binding domain-containing protein [Candidatus Paracaedibacteraceae bacterium]